MLLAAGGYALYRTGIATQWMQQLFPSTTAGDTVPAVFQQTAASQQTTITPATQVDKVEQFSITVEPQSAAVPASLVFTVRTNTAATAVRLLTESGTVIRTNASYFRQEDALVWQVSATIEAAYTGKVRVFLRDAAGGWSGRAGLSDYRAIAPSARGTPRRTALFLICRCVKTFFFSSDSNAHFRHCLAAFKRCNLFTHGRICYNTTRYELHAHVPQGKDIEAYHEQEQQQAGKT